MKFGSTVNDPLTFSVALLLLVAGRSFGFAPVRTTGSRSRAAPALAVNNDPFQQLLDEEYDREYAYRGDDSTFYNTYYNDELEQASSWQEDRAAIEWVNIVLRVLHNSFRNVEDMANELLNEKPVAAIAIFVGAGLLAAYMLGFVILDGCIESWNPVYNGMVPYWDDEILIMTRRIH